ncbi:MAG TPA: 50S ribosomal protein L21e [Thermoplasmataceae archaeon]|nr:50S ribosomal protein L21e [Thermoplasmatales archaeon AK]HLH85931.1 50S ribosomal protein L21e [Thermoplasmataceae archaeon]
MVKMSHGPRAGSRRKMTKNVRDRGMPRVNRFMQSFNVNDLVAVDIEPSVHKGMPYHGFHGLTGRISGQQGSAYLVKVRVGGKYKQVLATPVHLKRIAGSE